MTQYSIRDLEKLSGIKAHTIRMWEQRYNLLSPNRTPGNIRLYNDDEMRKLLNIASLVNHGYKISKVSSLKPKELNELIEQTSGANENKEIQCQLIINQLTDAGMSYNEQLFEKAFSIAVLKFGLQNTYVKIIYPLLTKLGLMWGKADIQPAQEHFVSNLIKQKLFSAIDAVEPAADSAETWVLFLPEEEDHEIGLLFANYLIRSHGKKVIYLGQRVPLQNLTQVIDQVKPECLQLFYVKNTTNSEIETTLKQIAKQNPNLKVYISISQNIRYKIKLPVNCSRISSIDHFLTVLKN